MLYISDLDGTLLDNEGKLSSYTKDTITDLMSRGMEFTIATARSYHSAKNFIEELGLTIPVILRNGASIYHPISQKYLINRTIPNDKGKGIIQDMIRWDLNPIVHCIYEEKEYVDYICTKNIGEETYINNRLKNKDRRIRKVDSFNYEPYCEFIAICSIDNNEKQRNLLHEIQKTYGFEFSVHAYPDNYSNFTWLEFNHLKATKESGAEEVLKLTGKSGYIAFGDNINDLNLLINAKKAYITENSVLHNRNYPFEVIESNNYDGVAKKLKLLLNVDLL